MQKQKKKTRTTKALVPVPTPVIARRILIVRGKKVMLDADIAELYQVPTKALNQAVQRNRGRFPADFMFRLTKQELENWRSQTVTSNPASKMSLRRAPYAFTEHGVTMLASVLRSKSAVQMSILIVRAFIKMRELLASHKDLTARLEKVEMVQRDHGSIITVLAEEIDGLKRVPEPRQRRIGFATEQK